MQRDFAEYWAGLYKANIKSLRDLMALTLNEKTLIQLGIITLPSRVRFRAAVRELMEETTPMAEPWVRKQLRVRDLRDLANGVPVLGRTMYRERMKRLLRSQRAQQVAKRLAANFRIVCKRVVEASGAAVKG